MSTSPQPTQAEIDALIQRLGAMPLAPSTLSREQLFFRAGLVHGAARHRRRAVLAAMVMTCIGLVAGVFVERWTSPAPGVQEIMLFAEPPKPEAKWPPVPKVVKSVAPGKKEKLTETSRNYPVNISVDALLSETDPPPMLPAASVSESLEDILGLPAGTLGEIERNRRTMR
jgi:hypothetical protein